MLEKLSEVAESIETKSAKNIDRVNPDKLIGEKPETESARPKTVERQVNPDKLIEPSAEKRPETPQSEHKGEVKGLKERIGDCLNELKSQCAYPETLGEAGIDPKELRECSPDEAKQKRSEFQNLKPSLIDEWEARTGKEWPEYSEDVVTETKNGPVVIRQAGDRYDAHHIKPLSLGGGNSVDNITPIHAANHFDHKGVHATDGALDRLDRAVKGGIANA